MSANERRPAVGDQIEVWLGNRWTLRTVRDDTEEHYLNLWDGTGWRAEEGIIWKWPERARALA